MGFLFFKKKKMLGNTWLEKGGLILVVMIFPTLCGGNEKQKCPFQDVISPYETCILNYSFIMYNSYLKN